MMCLSFGLNYFIGITKSRVFCLFYANRSNGGGKGRPNKKAFRICL